MHQPRTILLSVIASLAFAGCAVETSDASPPATGDTQPSARHDVVKHKLVRVRQRIGFASDTIRTSTMDKGEAVVQQAGKAGVRVRVVRVTLENGVEVDRDLVKAFVAQAPVRQVRLVGTHVEPKVKPQPKPQAQSSDCDSNYTGACVPVASDVDCAGGSGDGPEYVEGPVTVVGSDVYDLNRDDDNIACDS